MIQFAFWVIVAVFLGSCVTCLMVGYHLGREDRPEPRHAKQADPPPAEDDGHMTDDEWASFVEQLADEGRERMLKDTGELQRLYGADYPPYPTAPQLTDTGELRALALTGNLDAIHTHVTQWKKEIDQA